MKKTEDIFRALQHHFDTMPIGFPRTRSGVDLKILRHFFSPEEAQVALVMDFTPRTASEIQARLWQAGIGLDEGEAPGAREVEKRLRSMAEKGSILTRNVRRGERTYAAMPLLLGMHEMQLPRLTAEYLRDLGQFMKEGFGLEYISTAVPQTRIIPIEESVTPEHGVATYDEVRRIIDAADPIFVGECICRKTAGMAGRSCSVSHRTEVCMGLGDFGAAYADFLGFGREVSRREALDIMRQNEQDGLVLQPSNQQNPYFICSCCGDCCGLLLGAKRLPRPVDFFASNYFARVDGELCRACGKCVARCQMEAVSLRRGKAVIDERRCIGCGVCVPTCSRKALSLAKKTSQRVPPGTDLEYFDVLAAGKKSPLQKLITGVKAMTGIAR